MKSDMRFVALDGWRGVCALLVALYHLPFLGHFYGWPWLRNAYLFVDFFFVLSGFVITHAYWTRIRGGSSFSTFMVQRFGRIWPLHVFTLGAMVGLEVVKLLAVSLLNMPTSQPVFGGGRTVLAIFTNLLGLQAFGVHGELTWNWPSWSISAELYTYAVFGLVLLLARTKATQIMAAIAMISAILLIVFSDRGIGATYDFGFVRCLFGFFVGHLAYRLYSLPSVQDQLSRIAGTAIEVSAVTLVVLFLVVAGRGPASFAAPLIFAGVILVFGPGRGALSRLLSTKAGQHLGLISYSIYMVHAVIIVALGMLTSLLSKVLKTDFSAALPVSLDQPGREGWLFFNMGVTDLAALAYLALVLAVATLTFTWIEQPAKRWFYSLRPSPRPVAEEAMQ